MNNYLQKGEIDVISLTEPGLEKLYLGNKFAQWLCLEINQTRDIVWDNLVKDYRLSLDSISSNKKFNQENLQVQLRHLSTYYLDVVCIDINEIFSGIKSFSSDFLTYYQFLQATIENYKDKNYLTIINTLQKKIHTNQTNCKVFSDKIDNFLDKVKKNLDHLVETERNCRAIIKLSEEEIDYLLQKIEEVEGHLKNKNISLIKDSYKSSFSLVFGIKNHNIQLNEETDNDALLNELMSKLEKYNREYSILVQLVYCSKYFNEVCHTIKLGINKIIFFWETLANYFNKLSEMLQANGEEAKDSILLSLKRIEATSKVLVEKIKNLEDLMTMELYNANHNPPTSKILNSELLRLICQK